MDDNQIERRHSRTNSDSTMASSAAEEWRRRHLCKGEDQLECLPAAPTIMNLGGNENVNFSSSVHNYYYYNPAPAAADFSAPKDDSANTAAAKKTSIFSKFCTRVKPNCARGRRRKLLVISAIAVFSIASVAIYALVRFSPQDFTTTTTKLPNIPTEEEEETTTTKTTSNGGNDSPNVTTTTATTTTTTRIVEPFESLVSREEWNASDAKMGIKKLENPIKRIIVAHSGGDFCSDFESCKSRVKAIQDENAELDDIPFNFLVGGDGRVYVGRGFGFEGQHTANRDATEYNSIGICVAFVGNYSTVEPSEEQLGIFRDFVGHFRGNGSIANDYIVVLQDDLKYNEVQATALNLVVREVDHFFELQRVHRREEWQARNVTEPRATFNRTLNWVLIDHTDDINHSCNTVENCKGKVRERQAEAMDVKEYSDISHNFLVGSDGSVFEGRGWDIEGAHTASHNANSIGIAALGSYNIRDPTEEMRDAIERLMEDAAALGKLTSDFEVNGRQEYSNSGPGDNFMKFLKEWCRYRFRETPCEEES